MAEPSELGWAPSFVASILASGLVGWISALFSINRFRGEAQSTLDAHDKRLTTLENDIRYEVRALRDQIAEENRLNRDSVHEVRSMVTQLLASQKLAERQS